MFGGVDRAAVIFLEFAAPLWPGTHRGIHRIN
jgi:hypothetical protein